LKEAKVPEFKRGEYYVYTIKLRKNLPKNTSAKRQIKMPNNGSGRFYVGMTGLHPYERYLNHIRGYKASWAANKMAITMTGFEGPMTREEAEAREPARAQELRDEGYDVHSN
jgi:predicted GIY-YIG superfamily endonuclease